MFDLGELFDVTTALEHSSNVKAKAEQVLTALENLEKITPVSSKENKFDEFIERLFGGASDEEGKGGFNILSLFGGGEDSGNKKGGLLGQLLGSGGEGSEDGENPLEAVFASYYQKYLHGDDKDLRGMVEISEDYLQQINTAYEQALHGDSEEKGGAIGIIPATFKATTAIADARDVAIQRIDEKGKSVLAKIAESVAQEVGKHIGHIARMVAGIIGVPMGSAGRGGGSGNYTPF